MANKIQVRRGTKAQITAAGPFAAGEPVYALDTRELVIGNGTGANTPVVTATSADITYYVRTDGNDTNTGLANTAGGAFKTIGRAIGMIPQVVNHAVNIFIGPGTYNEGIGISGLSGAGVVNISGGSNLTQSSSYVVTGRLYSQRNSCRIAFGGFRTSYAGTDAPIVVTNSMETFFQFCSTVTDTSPRQMGVFVENGKTFLYSCNISNKASAIRAHVNAEILLQDCTGQGNDTAHYAAFGGKIHVSGNPTISGITFTYATEGGIVTTFGNGVINPWGDNTTASRSFSRATSGVSVQNLAANTWTKAQYPSENNDHLNEYDTGLSRFVAKQSGVYQINATALLNNGGTAAEMVLYANGSFYQRLDYCYVTSGFSYELKGSACVELSAGDYLEIYVRSSTANTLSTGWEGAFAVSRIS